MEIPMSLSQVVAATASGVLYDTVPPNKSTLVDNNGGAASKITSTVSTDMVGVSVARYDGGVFGSTVTDNYDTEKALNTGIFAYDNESPIAKRVTSSLSTVSNDFLLSGAADPTQRRSIHKLEVLRTRRLTTAIREGHWNEFTGEFDGGYPVVAVDTLGTDNAAIPNRSVPGTLSYAGQSEVVTSNYSEKTG